MNNETSIFWFLALAALFAAPRADASCTWYDSSGNSYSSQAALCSSKSGPYGTATPFGGNCCQFNGSGVCNIGGLYSVCTPCVTGQIQSSGYFDLGTDPSARPRHSACDDGCSTYFTGNYPVGRALVDGKYHYFGQGTWTQDGTTCITGDASPNGTPAPPPDECAAGQRKGTVNGVTVCLDPITDQPQNPHTPPPTPNPDTTTTITNPDGSKTTTIVTNNNNTTTTTIITTSADGQTTSSSSSTTGTDGGPIDPTGPEGDFCKANPTAEICVKAADECAKYPDRIGCLKLGETPNTETEVGLIPVHEITVSTVFFPIGNGGTCPADLSLSFLDHPLTWSFGPICQFAEMIRPLVVIIAWLSFGTIVVAGLKR